MSICWWFNGDISLLESLAPERTPKLVAKISKTKGGKL
jgi:hypothetical protein